MKLSEYVKRIISMRADFEHEQVMKLLRIQGYTAFLTQELNLSMFVPAKLVDGKWEVLEEPDKMKWTNEELENTEAGYYWHDYQKAKENVIFDGFLYNKETNDNFQNVCSECLIVQFDSENNPLFSYHKTIEDIIDQVELTDEVKKRFNIC